jgi:hypothetical protein
MFVTAEALGESVSGLSIGGDVVQSNLLLLDFLAKEVMAKLNVFGVVMELGVLCNGNGRLVVDAESGGRG